MTRVPRSIADTAALLAMRYLDNDLAAGEHDELRTLLTEHPQARRIFVALCSASELVHESLVPADDSAAHKPDDEPQRVVGIFDAANAKSLRFRPHHYAISAIAAALFAACGVAIYLLAFDAAPTPDPATAQPGPPVATLIGSSDGATVIVNDGIANPGEDYTAGAYSIASGTAQLMLTNAVDIKLRGDTRLHVHNNMHATLSRGSATFTCPPGTEGYAVTLPDESRITDLGTSFAIAIDDTGAADVRVLRGEIAWTSTGPLATSVVIRAGQMAVWNDGRVEVRPTQVRTAYVVPAGTVGNQEYAGSIGMDFDTVAPVTITHLGAFDSAGDGLKRPITVTLYDRETERAIVTRVVESTQGELIGSARFIELENPIRLPAEFAGTIAASGYGPGEPLGNGKQHPDIGSVDGGEGAIRFVGSGRYGDAPDAFARIVDKGAANAYAAGSFRYIVAHIDGEHDRSPANPRTETQNPRPLERSSN